MQPAIHFLEVGDTHMFLSALSSVSRPPAQALAENERHPDRDHVYDHVYGTELFWLGFCCRCCLVWGFFFCLTVTYWCLAESKVPAFKLQMVFIK